MITYAYETWIISKNDEYIILQCFERKMLISGHGLIIYYQYWHMHVKHGPSIKIMNKSYSALKAKYCEVCAVSLYMISTDIYLICETWTISKNDKYILQWFENKMLRTVNIPIRKVAWPVTVYFVQRLRDQKMH